MNRSEVSELIALAARLLDAGAPAALSTLFWARGSTYRPLGSLMVSGPGSIVAGGISGGCLEEYVARQALRLTEDQPAALICFSSDSDEQAQDIKPTLGCGGSIQVLVERLTPAHFRFLRELAGAFDLDAASTFATIVESKTNDLRVCRPPQLSLTMIGDTKLRLLQRQTIAAGRSLHDTIGEGTAALVHFVPPLRRLVIFGAGNDAIPLVNLARSLGWHVAVIDRRARLATRARFPHADQVVAGSWDLAVDQITFTSQAAAVLMTHSLQDDAEILPLLAESPLAYVGALGPESRRQRLLEEALHRAPMEQRRLVQLHGPIGLDLGDRSPAGIAVSIMAQILAEMNGRDAGSLSRAVPLALERSFNYAVADA